MLDISDIADVVAAAVKEATGPLLARIEALETRPPVQGEKGERGDAGPQGERGASGVGVSAAFRDQKGHLLLTMSDGSVCDIGDITGAPGPRGERGTMGPQGERGEKGSQGETFSLDDFDITPLDERTIKMSFEKGDQRHSFELEFPVPVYRGVWREGETYSRGDMVTWAGSTWHCEEKSIAKPGEVSGNWTLAVKAGRPGRDKT